MDYRESEIWEACFATLNKMRQGMGGSVIEAVVEIGLDEAELMLMTMADGYAPEPISTEAMSSRVPHNNAPAFLPVMVSLTEKGFLETAGTGLFAITDKGADASKTIDKLLAEFQDGREGLESAQMAELADLLERAVKTAAENGDNYCVNHSNWTKEVVGDGGVMRVFRALNALNAFRDDAHLQAWRPLDVTPIIWESSHTLWREGVANAEALSERFAYRRFQKEDYAGALGELEGLGWVQDGVLTEKGVAVKAQAEVSTNTYFDAVFADVDQERLIGLLNQLSEKLA